MFDPSHARPSWKSAPVQVAGFLMTGTSAKVPAGSIVKSFVDEDVPLSIAATAPPPLAVNAAVPVASEGK